MNDNGGMQEAILAMDDNVHPGCCCLFTVEGNELLYAGPIEHAPKIGGSMVVLHSIDVQRLKDMGRLNFKPRH